MTPDDIAALFTHADGSYHFARWGRPIVPVVFGVEDQTLSVLKGAIEAVVTLAGHKMAETDAELGANLMVFFFRDWAELPGVPGLEGIVPDLDPLCSRLGAQGATHYRLFRFDEFGSIRAAFVFLRIDGGLADVPAEYLALSEAAQMICLWSDSAFAQRPILTQQDGNVVLNPQIAAVIRAVYDPILPVTSKDTAHALRVFGRVSLEQV
jgi:hypothetical protein